MTCKDCRYYAPLVPDKLLGPCFALPPKVIAVDKVGWDYRPTVAASDIACSLFAERE